MPGMLYETIDTSIDIGIRVMPIAMNAAAKALLLIRIIVTHIYMSLTGACIISLKIMFIKGN